MCFERLERSLRDVQERIERACARVGRSDADAITLVAVTKGHAVDTLYAARNAGLETIGENRVQEARSKWDAVGDLGLDWHLIGHLQRNKVRGALEMFSLVHSVDSMRLALEIEKEAAKQNCRVPVLIQVNASHEEAKHGVPVEEALAFVSGASELKHLQVVGLMTMAPFTSNETVLRETFRRTRALYESCGERVERFEPLHLSMGMTNDYEIAIEEGSNMLRLGTALFGERAQ
jgi:pyridoxal phosphate enzyme (YggS family)